LWRTATQKVITSNNPGLGDGTFIASFPPAAKIASKLADKKEEVHSSNISAFALRVEN